jgi:hypothetical protein
MPLSEALGDDCAVSESKLVIRYTLGPDQCKFLKCLVRDLKDKVSSLSTEAILLHEKLKEKEKNVLEGASNGTKRSKYPLYGIDRIVIIA